MRASLLFFSILIIISSVSCRKDELPSNLTKELEGDYHLWYQDLNDEIFEEEVKFEYLNTTQFLWDDFKGGNMVVDIPTTGKIEIKPQVTYVVCKQLFGANVMCEKQLRGYGTLRLDGNGTFLGDAWGRIYLDKMNSVTGEWEQEDTWYFTVQKQG